jgi:hypothetical protein
VKGLNPNDKIEDLYIESPPFLQAAAEQAAGHRHRSCISVWGGYVAGHYSTINILGSTVIRWFAPDPLRC